MEPEDLQPRDPEHSLFSRVENVASEILPVKGGHTLFPCTVVQLPGQPHKYITGFLKEMALAEILYPRCNVPVGAPFKTGPKAV